MGETVLRWDGAKEATEMTDGVHDLSKVHSSYGPSLLATVRAGHRLPTVLRRPCPAWHSQHGASKLQLLCVAHARRHASSWIASWTFVATRCLPAQLVGCCSRAGGRSLACCKRGATVRAVSWSYY